MRLITLGVGAQNSPRYAPAGLAELPTQDDEDLVAAFRNDSERADEQVATGTLQEGDAIILMLHEASFSLGNVEATYEWLASLLTRLHVLAARVAGVASAPGWGPRSAGLVVPSLAEICCPDLDEPAKDECSSSKVHYAQARRPCTEPIRVTFDSAPRSAGLMGSEIQQISNRREQKWECATPPDGGHLGFG